MTRTVRDTGRVNFVDGQRLRVFEVLGCGTVCGPLYEILETELRDTDKEVGA